MHVSPTIWVVSLALTAIVFAFDIFYMARNPHVPSRRETTIALGSYVGAAIAFGLGVWYFAGGRYAGEYFAGWLTEYSLSVDNLFIFLIIMASFRVPPKFQQEALMVGIVIALVMRGLFIALGAAVIERFSWVFYVFGLFLILTALKMAKEGMEPDHGHGEDEFQDSRVMAWVKRHARVADSWEHGSAARVKINGQRYLTPMALVILALGTTDLMFALDSIPAIFGLTQEPYLVLMANVFALMGLRQLYFLIGSLLKKLVYLSLGLSVLLVFIGVKLILHAMHTNELPFINGGEPFLWAPEIPIWLSLSAIVVILGVTTVASLLHTRGQTVAEVEPREATSAEH